MPKLYYRWNNITGGGEGDLDGIDGAILGDKDGAVVGTTNYYYLYQLNATSGAAEDPPYVIAPHINAGDKRWILRGIFGENGESLYISNLAVNGGTIPELNRINNFIGGTQQQNGNNILDESKLAVNGGTLKEVENPISLNKNTVDQDWEIPSGYHGSSVGPLNINAEITISENSVWEVL